MSKPKQIYEPRNIPTSRDVRVTTPYIVPQHYPMEQINELFQAVNENNMVKVNTVVTTYKIPLEVQDEKGDTLLHIILKRSPMENTENKKLETITVLHNVGNMILTPNKVGITPLHIAAMYQYSHIIEKLCNPKMNISPKDFNGKTPLHYAIIGYTYPCKKIQDVPNKEPENDVVRGIITENDFDVLLAKKDTIPEKLQVDTKLNTYDYANNDTCIASHIDTIRVLLKMGASMHIQDKQKMTPIYYALINSDIHTIRYLIDQELLDRTNIFNSTAKSVYGEPPFEFYNKMYQTHLSVFSDEKPTKEKINRFCEPFTKQFMTLVSSHNEFKNSVIEQLPLRTMCMFMEWIAQNCYNQ